MKKYISIFLLIGTTSYSQIFVSPKFGVVLSHPKGSENNVHSEELKKTALAGIQIECKLENEYSLFFEVNRSDKGLLGKRDFLMNFGYSPYELDINMLNFYVGGKYTFYKNYLLQAGVYYGRVLSVEETYSDEYYGNFLGVRDISYLYEKDDYGLMMGFEYMIYKGFYTEFTYVRGFGDLRRDETHSGEAPAFLHHGSATIKTQIFSVGIGYKFKIGGR